MARRVELCSAVGRVNSMEGRPRQSLRRSCAKAVAASARVTASATDAIRIVQDMTSPCSCLSSCSVRSFASRASESYRRACRPCYEMGTGEGNPRELNQSLMGYEEILYRIEDGLAEVTLNRPDKLNAWTWRMGAEVQHAL